MKYFDLHCDTLYRFESESLKAESEKLQVNIKKSNMFEEYRQCFAIWLDDSVHFDDALKKAERIYLKYKENEALFSSIENFKAYLTIENASSFGGSLNNIALWKNRGAVMATLTWNGKNELASGALCRYGGLSEFGKDAVFEMENCGMCLDVSHLNFTSFRQVCKAAKKPFCASHSNCFGVTENKRNLKDYQIKAIAERGGIIGICFYPAFLGQGDVYENIYRHICYLIETGKEDCVAFGSDFDGAVMDKKLDKTEKVLKLYGFLKNKGLGEELLKKIFYKNAENFFNMVLQA